MTYEEEAEIEARSLEQIAEQILAGFTAGIAEPDEEGSRVSWNLEMEVVKHNL